MRCRAACLHEAVEAERALRIFEQLAGNRGPQINSFRFTGGPDETAMVYLLIGHQAEVLDYFEAQHRLWSSRSPGDAVVLRNRLRLEPAWDPLRGEPRFEALLKEP